MDYETLSNIYKSLDRVYPRTKPYLEYTNAFELLIAVIMSAQTTDNQVNSVTSELFARFPTPQDLSIAAPKQVETIIRSTGYYRTKAKNIIATARELVRSYGSEVPEQMEELVSLPGVGRKTANVIRGVWFGHPAIIVDTHFSRVTRRLGLTKSENPDKIEQELLTVVPERMQTRFSMTVNTHGRMCCSAKDPSCNECPIQQYCPYPDETTSN